MSAVFSKSKTKKKERDLYATPINIFNRIQSVANIKFVHDVCALKNSAKCATWWNKKQNALKIKWSDHFEANSPLWMNPPYSQLPEWTEKAALEAQNGLIIMGLVPDCRSSSWYENNLDGVATTAFIPDGRINFIRPNGTVADSNAFPSVFPLWTPWQTDHTHYSYFDRTEKKVVDMGTIKLKGKASRNFIASLMVDSHGRKALENVSKGSPIEQSIKDEIALREKAGDL